MYNLAFFYDGGELLDKDNKLTSDWGEYNLETNEAIFNYNVKLKNPQFDLLTDTLHYNTDNKIARIVGPSTIYSGTRIIKTKAGYYDTQKKFVELSEKALYNDSTNIDSISEIKTRCDSDRFSDNRNVIFTDTVNKNILKCDYLYYKELEGLAVASDDPVMMEYSQGDTLYMHSDTIRMYTYNMDTDSVYRKIHCYNKVKTFRKDVQAVSDSMTYNTLDSCLTMYRSPIVWNDNKQLTGDKILVFLKDSTISKVDVLQNSIAAERTQDSTRYNQISSRDLYAFFEKGDLVRTDAVDNVISVFYPQEEKDSSAMMMIYIETDTMRTYLSNRQLDKIWTPAAEGTTYPLIQIPKGKDILPGFIWYDYLRPKDKYDIFNWREKKTPKIM